MCYFREKDAQVFLFSEAPRILNLATSTTGIYYGTGTTRSSTSEVCTVDLA